MDRKHNANQLLKKREREKDIISLLMGDQGISQELQQDLLDSMSGNNKVKLELHQPLDLSRKTF